MTDIKKQRLESITDEVKEFHPLLTNLLYKMPDIQEVEYTHGQNEMGADFVLSSFNKIFGRIEYIGVIAKLGGLTQNFSSLERQIDECSMPRPFAGGKEKIYISEIWIILTGVITKNAQEKIHEKFKGRKIEFISGLSLVKLIDNYVPHYWSSIPLKIGEYLSQLNMKYKEIDTRLSLLNIDDRSFYIEQDIYYNPHKSEYKKIKTHVSPYHKVNILEEIEKENFILVEGGMGAGKSKLTRRLIDNYTKPETYIQKKLLPIPISYKDIVNLYNSDPILLIDELNTKWAFDNDGFGYLLLIDAVDEKNQPIEECIRDLKKIIQKVETNIDIKVIITCRYLKGYNEIDYFDGKVRKYELCYLSVTRMIEFLKKLCSKLSIANKIVEDLKKSQLIKELPKTPIAAIILAKLINENPSDLPSNLTELYMKYIELMLGRWDIEKGLQSQKEYQALDHILMELANHVIENESNQIPKSTVIEVFKRYLDSRHLDISSDELYKKMIDRCEIIAEDVDGTFLFFKHRTFAEFFYANNLDKNNNLEISERGFDIYWSNIYFFYFGIKKDHPEALRKLVDLHPKVDFRRWLKIINMANFYLAAYATPYNIVADGLSKIFLEAACLFKDIISGNVKAPFKNISHMGMLYFMQLIIRETYAYDYFKNAIVDAAMIINDSKDYDNETKAYAIFFLNVTYIDLKGTDSFDFLLKDFINHMPIDLSLAVQHESKNLPSRSKYMKKQDRYIKSITMDDKDKDRPIRSKIESLYKESIGLKKAITDSKDAAIATTDKDKK